MRTCGCCADASGEPGRDPIAEAVHVGIHFLTKVPVVRELTTVVVAATLTV
jgi:hypothetical protein